MMIKFDTTLSEYNERVLRHIILKTHKLVKYDYVRQVNETDFCLRATAKQGNYQKLIYISKGKVVAHMEA